LGFWAGALVAGDMGRVIGQASINALSFAYGSLPRRIQLGLGSVLGGILYLLKVRRSVVEQNLLLAYPPTNEMATNEVALRVLRGSYRHLGQLALDVLLVIAPSGGPCGGMNKFVRKRVELRGMEHAHAALAKGKGLLFLSSHVGNWEIMAASYGVWAQKDLLLVTKRLKPEWLHELIENGRKRYRVFGTYEPKTMKDVLRFLKQNKAVGIVLDQYAGPPIGVRVPLFGVPVGTSAVLATLARRTGADVLPVVNYQKPDGSWVVQIEAPLEWIKKSEALQETQTENLQAGNSQAESLQEELQLNTTEYVAALEKHIRAHPEQWLWIHRRFKGELGEVQGGRRQRRAGVT